MAFVGIRPLRCVYAFKQRWEILQQIDRKCRFWQKKIIFSDEAHFDLGGYVNKQNCRIWDTENRHAYIELFGADFGPEARFFFKNEQGEAVTVNGDRYRVILNEFLFKKIQKEDIVNIWFQQDGIIGPFFFKNEQGEAVTVNGDRCWSILKEFLFTKIEEEDIGNI